MDISEFCSICFVVMFTMWMLQMQRDRELFSHGSKLLCMKALLSAGANVNAVNIHKRTALHWMRMPTSALTVIHMMTILMDHGADEGHMVLHRVAREGKYFTIIALVQRRAQTRGLNDEGMTASQCAHRAILKW